MPIESLSVRRLAEVRVQVEVEVEVQEAAALAALACQAPLLDVGCASPHQPCPFGPLTIVSRQTLMVRRVIVTDPPPPPRPGEGWEGVAV